MLALDEEGLYRAILVCYNYASGDRIAQCSCFVSFQLLRSLGIFSLHYNEVCESRQCLSI